jgi:hypothetical protein
MKLTKTANGYKVELSRQDWQQIGVQQGWIKAAGVCDHCGKDCGGECEREVEREHRENNKDRQQQDRKKMDDYVRDRYFRGPK